MEINQKIDKTVDWLREKVKEAGCKGLVVGVSGGIDSAVVCYLIKKAFPENSIGVIMSINSNPKDREDALKVINGCGIDYIDLDLTKPQEMILNSVTSALKEKDLYSESRFRAADSIPEDPGRHPRFRRRQEAYRTGPEAAHPASVGGARPEIGRASCRERV